MHLGAISFCDKVAYNLKDDADKKAILADIEALFGMRIIQRHFDTFTSCSQKALSENPYMLCLRSNGNPYFLFLTSYNGVPTCIFVDKKVQQGYYYPRMITTKLSFDDDLFCNTLFDGEMVKDSDGHWTFLIHDVIGLNGVKLSNVNLVKRLNILHQLLDFKFVELDHHVCFLRIKKYVTYSNVSELVCETLPSLKYTCRGMYFRPLFLKFKDILINFDETLIKRPKYRDRVGTFVLPEECVDEKKSYADVPRKVEENSICVPRGTPNKRVLNLKKTPRPDVYELHDNGSTMIGHACVPGLGVSKMLRKIFELLPITELVPFECEYNEKFAGWVPKVATTKL